MAEVTSLGLVQMTRKRVGQGLLEAYSEPCPTCGGRGHTIELPSLGGAKAKPKPIPRPPLPRPEGETDEHGVAVDDAESAGPAADAEDPEAPEASADDVAAEVVLSEAAIEAEDSTEDAGVAVAAEVVADVAADEVPVAENGSGNGAAPHVVEPADEVAEGDTAQVADEERAEVHAE